jgi:hypothetical protein
MDSYGYLFPIFSLVLGIITGVLVIVWLEREISAGIQQRIGGEEEEEELKKHIRRSPPNLFRRIFTLRLSNI